MVVFELPSVVLASVGLLNSDELLAASLAKIETEYVLAVYDDFILEADLNNEELEKILLKMDSDIDIAAVYLTKLGLETTENTFLMTSRKEA